MVEKGVAAAARDENRERRCENRGSLNKGGGSKRQKPIYVYTYI
jgi:hypothetical protein